MSNYNSTVLTLVDQTTPDPWIVAAHGRYFLTFTCGDRIDIWSAPTLAQFQHSHSRKSTCIWRPPPNTEYSDGLWAPELHCLQGRWWVYFAAGHPAHGNASHRMFVLAGPPADQDPTVGPWQFAGPIQGMPPEQWAIDGTAFTLNNALFFVYSGWPRGETRSDLNQHLFILRLNTPTQAATQPVEISKPTHHWEFSHDGNGAHGINEGPQYLEAQDGSWKGLVYSCAGSWTKDYKMAVLHYRGGDPLNTGSWMKDSKPLIEAAPGKQGPWGPGHGSFMHLGSETCAIYHATDRPTDGWDNRKARCQRVIFTQDGPHMGNYCGALTTDLDAFTKGIAPPSPGSSKDGQFHALFSKVKDGYKDFIAKNKNPH